MHGLSCLSVFQTQVNGLSPCTTLKVMSQDSMLPSLRKATAAVGPVSLELGDVSIAAGDLPALRELCSKRTACVTISGGQVVLEEGQFAIVVSCQELCIKGTHFVRVTSSQAPQPPRKPAKAKSNVLAPMKIRAKIPASAVPKFASGGDIVL
jgi:hypothetical protein